jgi:hypothetical protein
MTDQQHPITPPQWQMDVWCKQVMAMGADVDAVLLEVFRAGADQELKACCEYIAGPGKWFANPEYRVSQLRAARRPKPKSQAEEALEAQSRMWVGSSTHDDWELVRSALERLRELEGGND